MQPNDNGSKRTLVQLESIIGISQPAITRWLGARYGEEPARGDPSEDTARAIAQLTHRDPDFWRDPNTVIPLAEDALTKRQVARALKIGFHHDVIEALQPSGAKGARNMMDLPEAARHAVLGVVHVTGYPLEITTVTARGVLASGALSESATAEDWYFLIRARLPIKVPSGTLPAAVPGN